MRSKPAVLLLFLSCPDLLPSFLPPLVNWLRTKSQYHGVARRIGLDFCPLEGLRRVYSSEEQQQGAYGRLPVGSRLKSAHSSRSPSAKLSDLQVRPVLTSETACQESTSAHRVLPRCAQSACGRHTLRQSEACAGSSRIDPLLEPFPLSEIALLPGWRVKCDTGLLVPTTVALSFPLRLLLDKSYSRGAGCIAL